jgi:uncharacterized protein with HEPN domain
MSRHDDFIRLQHMLDHAREASALIKGKNRIDLDTDRVLELALVRLLEIIGEAANRISSEMRSNYTGIPWFQIISLRHRLIHGYDAVDLDILWEILTKDLPPLIAELEKNTMGNHPA